MDVINTILSEKEFWELNHERNHTKWLTGSDPKEVLGWFGISPKDQKILDIGVGEGNMAQYLCLTNEVYSVDISILALNKVKDFCRGTFTTEELSKIEDNSMDCAICFLVFQHCQDNVVKFIIEQVYRILKPNGSFYFQFAFVDSTEQYERFMPLEDRKHIFLRSVLDIEKLLTPISFKIINTQVFNTTFFETSEFNITWNLYVINKI